MKSAMMMFLLSAASFAICQGQEACDAPKAADATIAHAMLQTNSKKSDVQSHLHARTSTCSSSLGELMAARLEESKACLPSGTLASKNVQALREHVNLLAQHTHKAPLLATTPKPPEPEPEPEKPVPPAVSTHAHAVPKGSKVIEVTTQAGFYAGVDVVIDAGTAIEENNKVVSFGSLILATPLKYDHGEGAVVSTLPNGPQAPPAAPQPPSASGLGNTASLDAAGFKAVTSLCCPAEMEQFFNRLLDQMGLDVCSKPHVQGLMHWFSCAPDMDFQYMVDVINNGNPCKYWGPKGVACPALTPHCEGKWCR